MGGFEIGMNEEGRFRISVQPSSVRGVYEVLVLEVKSPERHYYVHLANDPRFAWFSWTAEVGKFERKLSEDDLIEYNGYVDVVFHKIGHPLFKLTTRSVERLVDLCERLTKAEKKAAKKAEENAKAEPGST